MFVHGWTYIWPCACEANQIKKPTVLQVNYKCEIREQLKFHSIPFITYHNYHINKQTNKQTKMVNENKKLYCQSSTRSDHFWPPKHRKLWPSERLLVIWSSTCKGSPAVWLVAAARAPGELTHPRHKWSEDRLIKISFSKRRALIGKSEHLSSGVSQTFWWFHLKNQHRCSPQSRNTKQASSEAPGSFSTKSGSLAPAGAEFRNFMVGVCLARNRPSLSAILNIVTLRKAPGPWRCNCTKFSLLIYRYNKLACTGMCSNWGQPN